MQKRQRDAIEAMAPTQSFQLSALKPSSQSSPSQGSSEPSVLPPEPDPSSVGLPDGPAGVFDGLGLAGSLVIGAGRVAGFMVPGLSVAAGSIVWASGFPGLRGGHGLPSASVPPGPTLMHES